MRLLQTGSLKIKNPKNLQFIKKQLQKKPLLLLASLFYCWAFAPLALAQDPGIADKTIKIGSILPLEGDRIESGMAIKAGLEAALATQAVQNRKVELAALNDFYDPGAAVEAAKKLAQQGVFLMIGNHGTPTVKAILPLLAENKIPLLGPYTGAGFTEPGQVLNFRTTYIKEVGSVVDLALSAGLKPTEICGYVQNDSYGMAGLQGMRASLANHPNAGPIIAKLDALLSASGENPQRNNIGPIGVYQRGTFAAIQGYESLKKWEAGNKTHCRLVVTVGTFEAVSKFISYASYKGETWAFSMVSFTGTPIDFKPKDQQITNKLIQTQVVPPLDSPLPIVEEARKALGRNLN